MQDRNKTQKDVRACMSSVPLHKYTSPGLVVYVFNHGNKTFILQDGLYYSLVCCWVV